MEMLSQGYHSTETDDPGIPEVEVTVAEEPEHHVVVVVEPEPKEVAPVKGRTSGSFRLARQDKVTTKQEPGTIWCQRMNTSQYDNIWAKDAEILHFEV